MQDCWRAGFDAFDGYLDGTSHLERAEKAEARVAELEARDANGLPTHCVDRATWDEMGRALAAAVNERDEALARVAELESSIKAILMSVFEACDVLLTTKSESPSVGDTNGESK